jgi:hypothetical protein
VPLASNLSDDLTSIRIGDVDGIPGDDMVRFVASGLHGGRWDVSSGGETGWQTLARLDPAGVGRYFVGRFDAASGADVLAMDPDRKGHLRSSGGQGFAAYSRHAY